MRYGKWSSWTLVLFLVVLGVWLVHAGRGLREEFTQRSVSNANPEQPIPLKKARRVVQQKNKASAVEHRAFQKDGWSFVDTRPPDPRITDLDPGALPQYEAEIQVQLQTTSFSGDRLDLIRPIYQRASEPKTRYVALEALGRSGEARAQQILIDLFETEPSQDPGGAERQQILGYLRPSSLDDNVARFLLVCVSNDSLSDDLRQQAAYPLVTRSLLQGDTTLSGAVLDHVASPQWREKLQKIFETVRAGGMKHG